MPNTEMIDDLKEMGRNNTIYEAVMNVKDALSIAYPNSSFYIVACDTHLDKDGKPARHRIATKYGDRRTLDIETANLSIINEWLSDLTTSVALNVITSHTPDRIGNKEAAALHDAAIDYGKHMGLQVKGIEYCRDHPKWKGILTPKNDAPENEKGVNIHKIGQKVTPSMLEQHITQVRQELKRLEDMRNQATMKRMITDEIKRLKRKGELSAAKTLQDELDAYEAEQQRRENHRLRRIENAAKAREAKAIICEKRRRAKQQPPQPNFAKMAKQKRQQIAARQAEKKKKKASGGGGNEVKSCSQLLNR